MEPRSGNFRLTFGISEIALIIIAIFVVLAFFMGWNN
jgi:hypothetical protein